LEGKIMGSIPQLVWQLIRGLFRHRKSMAKLRSLGDQRNALQAVMDAHRRGDYEAALHATEGLREGRGATPTYGFFRGTMLMQLGQFAEAEKWLRESIARETDSRKSALGYSTLGKLLLEQQRYDEARECFEACRRQAPERGSSQRSIAEAWLRQGGHNSEALQAAKVAVDRDRVGEAVSQEVHDHNLGEDLATLAWAVAAATHDEPEVDRLVAEAVPLVDGGPTSSVAQVHYHSGRAYAALGDTGKSAHHFEEAARADRQGLWGQAARAMAGSVSR
jgi:tetratricopeptide (TPR) repeat protein